MQRRRPTSRRLTCKAPASATPTRVTAGVHATSRLRRFTLHRSRVRPLRYAHRFHVVVQAHRRSRRHVDRSSARRSVRCDSDTGPERAGGSSSAFRDERSRSVRCRSVWPGHLPAERMRVTVSSASLTVRERRKDELPRRSARAPNASLGPGGATGRGPAPQLRRRRARAPTRTPLAASTRRAGRPWPTPR